MALLDLVEAANVGEDLTVARALLASCCAMARELAEGHGIN